ncbi:MAG: Hpt domain-containing protein, partial [Candidatus Korobacteraceae bacterium]
MSAPSVMNSSSHGSYRRPKIFANSSWTCNADGLRELVDMFLNQTHKQFGQIEAAIRDGKADEVRRVAHSCAGASATLGMTRLVPKLRELEKLG